jgi:hypothetical protein
VCQTERLSRGEVDELRSLLLLHCFAEEAGKQGPGLTNRKGGLGEWHCFAGARLCAAFAPAKLRSCRELGTELGTHVVRSACVVSAGSDGVVII